MQACNSNLGLIWFAFVWKSHCSPVTVLLSCHIGRRCSQPAPLDLRRTVILSRKLIEWLVHWLILFCEWLNRFNVICIFFRVFQLFLLSWLQPSILGIASVIDNCVSPELCPMPTCSANGSWFVYRFVARCSRTVAQQIGDLHLTWTHFY